MCVRSAVLTSVKGSRFITPIIAAVSAGSANTHRHTCSHVLASNTFFFFESTVQLRLLFVKRGLCIII